MLNLRCFCIDPLELGGPTVHADLSPDWAHERGWSPVQNLGRETIVPGRMCPQETDRDHIVITLRGNDL
jgi:hypothetical protein